MLVNVSTDKSVSDAAAALQAAVEANHFGVMQVHNLKETMKKKGDLQAAESLRNEFEAAWRKADVTLRMEDL